MRTLPGILTTAVAVAVVGFVLARYGSKGTTSPPAAMDRQASVADFRINYPLGWRLRPPATVPLVPLGDVLTLGSGGSQAARLVIGTQQTTAPSALPPRLAAAVPATTKPQVVTLGANSFFRYLNLTPKGQTAAESLYSLPTTAGTITAVCAAPRFTTRITSSCERILSTIRVTAGDAMSVDVDPGYALALNAILSRLNEVRRAAGPGLRSRRVGTRERAAAALAAAHARAAAAIDHLSTSRPSSANRALVTALDQNAAAYKALEHAAAKQDVPAYGRARAALESAGSDLDGAYAQLRELGYQVR